MLHSNSIQRYNAFLNDIDTLFFEPKRYEGAFKIIEQPTEYVLRADVPGYGQEDIKVTVAENILSISGRIEQKDNKFSATRTQFEQKYMLPKDVDANNISADLKKGILVINLPKKKVEKEVRQIPIS